MVRDFEEPRHKQATGGHPDFNPTWNPKGWEGWGSFDNQADFIPSDRGDFGPALKPGFDALPNCFRSRFGEWYATRSPDINRAFSWTCPS